MGYTKVYDRHFLLADGKYIPICLSGASNVTEYINGREVNERAWDAFTYSDEMLLADAETLMDTVRSYHTGGCDECFTYHGKWLGDEQVIRFFENGIKNACTIEELLMQLPDQFLRVRLDCWNMNENSVCRAPMMDEFITTTERLVEWTEQAKKEKERLLASGEWKSCYLSYSFRGREPLVVSSHALCSGPLIVKSGNGYITEKQRDRCKIGNIKDAMVFSDLEAAVADLPFGWRYRFLPASRKESPKQKQSKQWVLSVKDSAGRRVYIQQLSSAHCWFCYSVEGAKRFSSEKEALRWYEQHNLGFRFRFTEPKAEEIQERKKNNEL